ncbi:MAG TPA: cation:proton antiporter [Acetobacteraceae bacterium]|nr:cation:proton antiporter [Acetobacteraceae bacterium]
MAGAHEIILVAGVLCLLATFAGLISARIGTPLLLVFIGIGMLAGEDGPGGIVFDDFRAAYLVGSLALAIILFQGGLSTERDMIRQALWPAVALATVGVAISAGLVGAAVVVLFGVSWPEALLLGAATAPTDAAAVTVLLRISHVGVPSRVSAVLEVESGLNDPMSVFLTVALVELVTTPEGLDAAHVLWLFAREMGGGAAIGLASGFLAVYLAGVIVGNHEHAAGKPVGRFFETLGWLAQIALFLMLGLLVTPHQLPPLILPALAVSAVLILVGRPAAVMACLLPFRWRVTEAAFVAWAGLRGAVPIFLTTIPLLTGVRAGYTLFNIVFVAVIVSVAVQGWTAPLAARLLRLERPRA